MKTGHMFAVFSNAVAGGAGKPVTFCIAFILIVVWAISGPFFNYSETWQLVVNTATTIVTFLMVFVLQNSQNRDSKALQTKLDELILTSHAQNKFMGVENLDEGELRKLSEALEKHAVMVREKAASKSEKSRTVSKKKAEAPAVVASERRSPSKSSNKAVPAGKGRRGQKSRVNGDTKA